MATEVENFYDAFSQRYIRDYVQGNLRVQRQIAFYADAVPVDTQSILVIGCGCGESALHLVTKVSPVAKVLAIDISSESVQMASKLCPHPQIQYQQADVIKDDIPGQWDVIAMPDVLEHIPLDARASLYTRFNELLSPTGRLLITCPAPSSRRTRRRAEGELQIIDEDVTVENLLALATAVAGRLSFLRLVSIWHPNDYFHAMIEREPDVEGGLSLKTATPLKGCPRQTSFGRFFKRVSKKLRLNRLAQRRRAKHVRRTLGQ